MSNFIPFPAYPTFAPIDISYLFEQEKPAGKHGFLQVKGERFVFEDGTPVRFWGTNLNSGACFPEKECAPKLARRLAAYGCNMVRFHQIDAEWATPNIYQFCKGKRLSNTSTYDSESFDRMDYLIYCLKREGIYIYLDMLTYRKFKVEDGVVNPHLLSDRATPYSLFDRRLIQLQKEYMEVLWEHKNPYTGLKYKDDPAIALSDAINEADLYGCFNAQITVEPYATNFREGFRAWCRENNIDLDTDSISLDTHHCEPLNQYKIKVTEDYYKEMFDYMRSIGVKIPFTGVNFSWKYLSCKAGQKVGDFMDSHLNVRYMNWEPDKRYYRDIALHEQAEWGAMRNARHRSFQKPFFTSEWDLTFPNKYRAESSIMMAAIGMLQNWSGYTIHTYAYNSLLDHMNILGKESSSATIGDVGYREGPFSTWNDPAKFGLFYHASIITRREDVKPANKKIPIRIKELEADNDQEPGSRIKISKAAFSASTELSQIGADYYGEYPDAVDDNTPLVDLNSGEVVSDTGELYRSWKKKYGTVDTSMTKCVYGRLGQNNVLELDGMQVKCSNDYAVIAISSLNNDLDLAHTDSMLLTAVGNVTNTDMQVVDAPEFPAPRDGFPPYQKLVNYGKPPIICEVIEADIALKTNQTNLMIRAVNAEGQYVGTVPVTYKDGWAHFSLGKVSPSIYYLIQAE